MILALKWQSCPQAKNPYHVFIRVKGRIDQQLHGRRECKVLRELEPVKQLGRILVIKPSLDGSPQLNPSPNRSDL